MDDEDEMDERKLPKLKSIAAGVTSSFAIIFNARVEKVLAWSVTAPAVWQTFSSEYAGDTSRGSRRPAELFPR